MITPRPAPPGLDPKPAFPMIPFFGVQPCLMDAEVGVLQGRLAFLPAGHSSESRTCPPSPPRVMKLKTTVLRVPSALSVQYLG